MSLEEVKKVIRASQVASVRARLLTAGESCISYSDFVRICCEATNNEQGLEIARSLDESGLVLVFGNVVFLKPEEVTFLKCRFYGRGKSIFCSFVLCKSRFW